MWWTAAALTAGMLSGYYMAAMLALVVGAWVVFELVERGPGRGRFVTQVVLAGGAATAVLLVVSLPYFGRPELAAGRSVGGFEAFHASLSSVRAAWTLMQLLFGIVPIGLALVGLAALGTRDEVARRTALAGLLVAIVGLAVVLPPPSLVAAIEVSPLRFLRAQFRFAAVAGLGTACLAAAALELVRARLGPASGRVAAVVAAALVIVTRGPGLSGVRPDRLDADRPIHETVASATRDDAGPLLVLPLVDAHQERHGGFLPLGQLESDDMIGSLVHWLPLVGGHTGYEPMHRAVLLEVLRALPDGEALDELVDLTHVRWLLLRPPDYWRDPRMVERLLALPGVSRTVVRDGWTLARVARPVRRPAWYEAIRAGYRADRTVLGTPLEALPDATAVAVVEPIGGLPESVQPAATMSFAVRVRNVGTRPWPVVVPATAPATHTVQLVARWSRVGDAMGDTDEVVRLRRDVPPADTIVQTVRVATPREPGTYRLVLGPEQVDGSRFDGPANVPLRASVVVAADGAAPAR